LQYLKAHSTWGLINRIVAKVAAYVFGIDINRMLGRSGFALASLPG
jgi:hypothetical protein